MKQFYKLICIVAVLLASLPSAWATEWSWDWPTPALKDPDKNQGYYNFGSSDYYDSEFQTATRTFNGHDWTVTLAEKGLIAAYTGSGQSFGQAGKGFPSAVTLSSSDFYGKVTSVLVSSRVEASAASVAVSVGGVAYKCEDADMASIVGSAPVERTFTAPSGIAAEGEVVISFTLSSPTKPLYVKKIAVVYEEALPSVEAPTFTPAAGSYDEAQTVSLSGPDGAEILYTLDGSNPRTEGNASAHVYDGAPFTVAETTTVKAVAKLDGEFSAVAEAKYIIRKSPELSFAEASTTIELLEEGFVLLNNPYRVSPIKYSSSSPYVANPNSNGIIYTFSAGETVISAPFAGNDEYLPQTAQLAVTVVPKEPLAPLTVTPGAGKYDDAVEVTMECTDERAMTLWYHIGDERMPVDNLGQFDDATACTITPGTKTTITLDHSCVLSVQAQGYNVWSEPLYLEYDITVPLRAKFEADKTYSVVYHNGFDSLDEANEWNVSTGSQWSISSTTGLQGVPPFSSINPESEYSLFHRYGDGGSTSVITSPDITIPADGLVRFYAAFNPIWIYNGNLILYIVENAEGAKPQPIWNALLVSQEAATDDSKWTQYSVDLGEYVGKEVYFAFSYALNDGDNVLIDDFEVVAPESGSSVEVAAGSEVHFNDLSTGSPQTWQWAFPGGTPETSTEQNPTVKYDVPGVYDVTLTVGKDGETATVTLEKYVNVRIEAPTAAIGLPKGVYFSPEASIVVPLNTELTFTDASTGSPESFSWTLPGTDVESATTRDVTVRYIQAGTYDVDLTVTNSAGTSSTYVHGVKAGGEALVWNIAASENDKLGTQALGWYGYYGGTNWLGMEAFAERFEAPAVPALVSSVNVYFGKADVATADADITVSLALPDAKGMPGQVLAKSTKKASELVDASETYNDPTEFVLDKAVKVDTAFFVTIGGFPNGDGDDIAMYVLRRGQGGANTAYHLLAEEDENYQPTGETKWYANEDDPLSFAIAPKIEFEAPQSGVADIDAATDAAPAVYYNLQGVCLGAKVPAPGLYIRRQGDKAEKVLVK